MTVMVANLDSDDKGYTLLRNAPKRRCNACPTVRAPKRRHTAGPIHLLARQNTSDSDVCFLKEDKGVNPEDPHYKIFLENLKLGGKSYALKLELEGSTVLLKYEGEEMSRNVVDPKAFGNMQGGFKKEMVHCILISQKRGNGRCNAADTFRKKDSEKHSNMRKQSSKEVSDNIWRKVEVKQRKGILRGKNVEVEEIITSTKMKRCRGKEFDKSVQQHNMHESAEDEMAGDKDILTFLQRSRKDCGFVVCTYDAGITLRYGEYEEEDGGSDVEIIDREDFSSAGQNNPFVSAHSTDIINIECGEGGQIPSSNDSEFRINLLKKLKEPYDKKEYEDLTKMVTYKRRKEVDKELRRGRGASYSTKDVCKSYLDVYKDFAKVLKRVKGDRCRTLNLLRGFKYWLHNVPKGGSFYPWLDSQCLSLLPGP